MSINLLDLFKDQLSGAAMKGISSMLGESESNTGSALGGIAATLLGSLAGKASDSNGAAGLLKDLAGADMGIMDNIGDLIGGDGKSSLLEKGGSLVSSLLGNNSNSVIDSITSMTGMGKGASGTLLKLAAPMIMGFVGKYVKSKALDAVGLGSLLGSQKDHIKSAMPSGLFDKMGFSSIGGAAKDALKGAAGTVSNVADTASSGGGGFLKPLIIALALLALAFFGYKSCAGGEKPHDDHANHTEEVEKKVDGAVNELEDDHGHDHAGHDHDDHAGHDHGDDTAGDAAVMDTKGLDFPQGSWEWALAQFLANDEGGSKTVALDKIPFEGDEISAEAGAQLDNLASILKAYPNISAEVQGHTPKAKNAIGAKAKKTASRLRAIWVREKLKARGVVSEKLTTAGYGDEQLLSSLAEDAEEQKRIVIKFNK